MFCPFHVCQNICRCPIQYKYLAEKTSTHTFFSLYVCAVHPRAFVFSMGLECICRQRRMKNNKRFLQRIYRCHYLQNALGGCGKLGTTWEKLSILEVKQNEPVECLRIKAAKGESSSGKRGDMLEGTWVFFPHGSILIIILIIFYNLIGDVISGLLSVFQVTLQSIGLAILSLLCSPEKCWRQRNSVFIVVVLPRLPFRYWLKYSLANQILVRLTQPLLESKIYEAYYWEGSGWVEKLVWIMCLLAMSLVFQN